MRRRSRSRSRNAAEGARQGDSSFVVAREILSDGTVCREYRSGGGIGGWEGARALTVDVASRSPSSSTSTTSLLVRPLRSALLPAGFEAGSVTSDYIPFQVYDSLQGLCSYVRGVCASNAVLSGLGVGDASSSSSLAAAAAVGVARDAVGMIAGFALAATAAPRMDSDAKRWRLAADVSNDVSLVLELVAAPLASAAASFWFGGVDSAPRSSFFASLPFLSPSPPSSPAARESERRLRTALFTLLICVAAAFRALVGVAGGATRAALTAHFCRGSRGGGEDEGGSGNNAGDVAAKEGAQEAAVTLVGMLLGLLLTTRGASAYPRLVALSFAVLTALHVYFNAKALRCLRLTDLNGARLELVVERMVKTTRVENDRDAAKNDDDDDDAVLSPAEAAALEPLWPPPFLDRLFGRRPRVVLGASLVEVAEAAGKGSVEELLDDDEGSLPFVGAFSRGRGCSLVALRSDVDGSASWEVAAFVYGLLLTSSSRGDASTWVRERWIGRGRRRRGGKNDGSVDGRFLAEELLERAGWDRVGAGVAASLGQRSSAASRYEIAKAEGTSAKRRAGNKDE